MSSVLIVDAVSDDAEGLVPLLDALGYPADAETIKQRFRALCETDPGGRVLVAMDGERIVGFASLHVTPVLHRAAGVGRITGIAVHPSHRGRGIGRELILAAEAHFRSLGLGRCEVTSGPLHTEAYSFYRRLGYVDHGIRFAKILTDPAGGEKPR